MEWVGDGQPLDEAGCRKWLDVTAENYRNRGYGMFALVERGSGEVIGFGGLVHPGGQTEAELKYALKRPFWGRGYATEAARALLEYGAKVHGLGRVMATVAPGNTASLKVLHNAGFLRESSRPDGAGGETLVFAWTSSERSGGPPGPPPAAGCGAVLPVL